MSFLLTIVIQQCVVPDYQRDWSLLSLFIAADLQHGRGRDGEAPDGAQ